MLHLIWYIFVGFLMGCVAKALMHMHLSITWTVVLGIVGSIIGGAVTHLFYPPSAGGKFHLGGINCFNRWGDSSFMRWHKFRLQLHSRITCLRADFTFRDGPPGGRANSSASGGRALPILREIDLEQFDFKLSALARAFKL